MSKDLLINRPRTKVSITKFLSGTCLVLFMAFSISCVGTPEQQPNFGYNGIGDTETPVAYSILAAERLNSRMERVGIYRCAVESYLFADWERQALNLLNRLYVQTVQRNDVPDRTSLLFDMAQSYYRLDRIERSKELLKMLLEENQKISSDAERADMLRTVISLCIAGGEEYNDIFRSALESVYILDNLYLRVSSIVDVIREYQEAGIGRSVFGLIQQALAASASIRNPYARAEAYSSIALRSFIGKEQDDASSLALRAIQILDDVDGRPGTDQEVQWLVRTSGNLLRLGYRERVDSFINYLSEPVNRFEAYVELAGASLKDENEQRARAYFRSAYEEIQDFEDQQRVLEYLIDLGEKSLRADFEDQAQLFAQDLAGRLYKLEAGEKKDGILANLAEVYALAVNKNVIDHKELLGILGNIENQRIRFSAYIESSSRLEVNGEKQEVLLSKTRELLEEIKTDKDELRRMLANRYMTTSRYAEAFSLMNDINSVRELSLSLCGSGKYLLGNMNSLNEKAICAYEVLTTRIKGFFGNG